MTCATTVSSSVPSLLRRIILLSAAIACGALALHGSPAFAGGATPAEMGAGVAWFDCDNDGDLDVFYLVPRGGVSLHTYDSGTDAFTDVSETAIPLAIRTLDQPAQGIVCGDFNNDGFADVFLTKEGPNQMLINNTDGTFRSVGKAAGISQRPDLSASVAILDYNNDGKLDIYVGNYMGMPNELYRNDGVDGSGTPKFTDVAVSVGVDLAMNGQSNWTLGLLVFDYDNDGDSDLYVANDYDGLADEGGLKTGENVLYRNNGDGTYSDVTDASGTGDLGWAMGVVSGDYDGDGDLDIFLANFWEDALLRNNGDGTFSNVTRAVGLITDKPTEWHYNGWGTAFFDFDNDGDLDIHVSNGYILNDQGQIINEPNQLWENKGNSGGAGFKFEEIGQKAGINDRGDARGAAYGDFNRDGLVDIMVINNGWLGSEEIIPSPVRMLHVNMGDGTFQDLASTYGLRTDFVDGPRHQGDRDATQNQWIQIAVKGQPDANPSAVGARVTVRSGSRTWLQDVGTSSYCSQNSPYLHFGLGQLEVIDEVTVRYPDGESVTIDNVAPDQIVTFTQGESPDITPVRLLSFGLASEADGVRIRWNFEDDGDLTAFTVRRRSGDDEVVVASNVFGVNGRGEVLDAEAPAGNLTYSLDAVFRDGSRETIHVQSFRHEIGLRPVLGQNFPNPFQGATSIPVMAPGGGAVEVSIFDASGRLVRRLDRTVPGGESVVHWDGLDEGGRTAPAGTYFYRLRTGDQEMTRKMIRRP